MGFQNERKLMFTYPTASLELDKGDSISTRLVCKQHQYSNPCLGSCCEACQHANLT